MGHSVQLATRFCRFKNENGPVLPVLLQPAPRVNCSVSAKPKLSDQGQLRQVINCRRMPASHLLIWVLAVVIFAADLSAKAQTTQHWNMLQPGGLPGLPVMTGIQKTTNGVTLTWYGPPGYYQLYQKLGLTGSSWQVVGSLNYTNEAIITTLHSNAFFRVATASPRYVGAQACDECHAGVHDTVVLTPHFGAFTNALFAAQGGQTNGSCLACHTVGAGLPTGFVSLAKTPQLAGVQCENCHGPAANHAADPDDPTVVPHVELAATMCGGCHNSEFVPASAAAYHPPRYEEWNTSLHRAIVPEVQSVITATPSLISTCGTCHSGTVREALLENETLPNAQEASAVGVGCATCHDAHTLYVHTNSLNGVVTNTFTGVVVTNTQLGLLYTNQIANPLSSMQAFATAGSFTTNYNPEISICAQCHNDRGALPTDTSFPPHNSSQYNLLLGVVGVLPPGQPTVEPATHAFLEKQCVACHMQTSRYVSPAQPANSGHSFEVDTYAACATCHGSAANAQNLATFLAFDINSQIQTLNAALNQWATTKAPVALQVKYGARAWEYTNPGSLSPGGPGPTAAEQSSNAVPSTIQQARFNLYLVVNDGSLGVHNPLYCLDLLDYAEQLVQQELEK